MKSMETKAKQFLIEIPGGLLDFLNGGGLLSSNFLRPSNNQTNFFNDPNY